MNERFERDDRLQRNLLQFPPSPGFRRRGAPVRRSRRNPMLALARPLAAALALVALPSGLALWVLSARRFQLRDVVVEGARERVSESWVRGALAPLHGENLLLLSLAELAARLSRHPWVESVEIEKVLPDQLHVEIQERRPVALLLSADGLAWADAAGRPIAPVASPAEREAARRAGLLVVRFHRPPGPEGIAPALAVAAELGRAQPDWAAALSRIEVLGEEDFRLHTGALPFPLLVTRGRLGPKVPYLENLLTELERRYAAVESVDLRFSRRIVVQPALPPRKTGAGA